MRYAKLVGLLALLILLPVAHSQTGYPRVRRGASSSASAAGAYKGIAGTFHGVLRKLNNKEILIFSDEQQTVTIRRSGKTKFLKDGKDIKASDIALETAVTVEATEDVDSKMIALSVTVDPPKKATPDQ